MNDVANHHHILHVNAAEMTYLVQPLVPPPQRLVCLETDVDFLVCEYARRIHWLTAASMSVFAHHTDEIAMVVRECEAMRERYMELTHEDDVCTAALLLTKLRRGG